MSSGIGGSGGIGGPRGPSGPGRTQGADIDGPGEALAADPTSAARNAQATGGIDRLAADLDAGRISADEALAELLADAVPEGLPASDRADLREALLDLLASDPYLSGLAAKLGATPRGDE